jgi:hypothetical protein
MLNNPVALGLRPRRAAQWLQDPRLWWATGVLLMAVACQLTGQHALIPFAIFTGWDRR